MKLKNRSLFVVLICFLFLIVCSFFYMLNISKELYSEIEDYTSLVIDQSAQVIDQKLKKEINTLNLISQFINDYDLEDQQIFNLLEQFCDQKTINYYGYIQGTLLYNDQNEVINIDNTSLLTSLKLQQNIILNNHDFFNEDSFIVINNIKNDNYLFITVSLDILDTLLSDVPAGLNETFLFNDDNNIFYKPLFTFQHESILPLVEDVNSMFLTTNYITSVTIEQSSYYLVVSEKMEDGWRFASIIPQDALGDHINSFMINAIQIWVFVSILMSVLIATLYRYRKKHRENLLKLAYEDTLTKHYNFNRFIELANAKNNIHDYYLIDLKLKEYLWFVEMYGLECSDHLFISIIQTLSEQLEGDELYCRTHLEHFVLLLNKSHSIHINNRIQDLMCDIRKQFTEIDPSDQFYFQINVYSIENNSLNIQSAYQRVKYSNKEEQTRKDTICYYNEDSYLQALYTKQIENDFTTSLENNEFKPFIQPKIDLKTKRIYSGEILTRWIHPTRGLIPPSHFIPILEGNGSLEKLDLYILNLSLQALSKWVNDYKFPITLSLNASRSYIFKESYIRQLNHLIHYYDIDPRMIEIEITESAILQNKEQLIEVINHLKANGFKISLDDFGSGYSSLNMLKDFSIDIIKIDQEFFRMTNHEFEKGYTIISEVIDLCHKLGMKVVSEGVETKEQVDFLTKSHCDYVQGYYFFKPMPLEEFEKKYVIYNKKDL